MLFRLARRFSIPSTKFFLLLTGASAIFVYLVSPTRDPDFGKFSYSNGGSPHWWLEGVREGHWTLAAFILAGLLAIRLTLDLWHLCKLGFSVPDRQQERILSWTEQLRDFLWLGMMHIGVCIGLWSVLFYGFFRFLLDQWLID